MAVMAIEKGLWRDLFATVVAVELCTESVDNLVKEVRRMSR
jgi:hypothetical protein